MDNKIDWSLAPKWSNAVVSDYDGDYWYVEEFGVVSKRRQRLDEFRPDGDIADMTTSYHSWKLVSERHKQWSGPQDGLPPVGADCEFTHNGGGVSGRWIQCKILGYGEEGDFGKTVAIMTSDPLWDENGGLSIQHDILKIKWRAIKSPEQIARDLRESKIVEFMNTVGIDCRVTATKAVDAGYVREDK